MQQQNEEFYFNLNPIENTEWNTTKNQTRISSILGPWTVYNNAKASLLPYSTGSSLSMYVLCDEQMAGNSCTLPFCTEFDSEVCLRNMENDVSCNFMNESIVDWSDAIVFIFIEYYVDFGFPYNTKHVWSTGEWVGPYHVVFAQDPDVYNEGRVTSDGELILDTYILKYLNAPSTEYLTLPRGCTMFAPDEFKEYLGAAAVNHTVQNQAMGLSFEESFEPYYKTCENGDIKPMLPYVNFTFVRGNDVNHTEKLYVRFEMKLLTYPNKESALYYLMPSLQDNGFPISGPYCYDGDPNRGWTFDLVFDSQEGTTLGTELEHSCIGDYECVPPQLEACNCSMAVNDNILFEPIEANNNPIGLKTDIYIEIATVLLIIVSIASIGYNFYLQKRIKELDSELYGDDLEDDVSLIGTSEVARDKEENYVVESLLS